MKNRPWCCCEHCCTPLMTFHDHVDITKQESGKSIFCWGKNTNIKFTYNEVEHNNDLNLCVYTPLKGCIRFQTNKEDWELLKIGCERGLQKLQDLENK